MSDDPLDKNVSIGAELTKTGLNLNAKSRAASALDRLMGNVVDFVNIPIERRNVESRTKLESERRFIEAVRDHALERMRTDPEFANRAAENYLRSLGSRQDNKDSVARHAIEDLRRDPSASPDADPELDPLFVNKIERHAEDASTGALREKWGRVLAAEIRRPGTISPRVLRIIDEIDAATAQMFETFCKSRLNNIVPRCLHELTFFEATKLVTAGLIVDPGGLGQVRRFSEVTASNGDTLAFVGLGRRGVAVPANAAPTHNADRKLAPVQRDAKGTLVIPSYVLTDEGVAVSQILPDEEDAAFERYLARLRCALPASPFSIFREDGTTEYQLESLLESDKSP